MQLTEKNMVSLSWRNFIKEISSIVEEEEKDAWVNRIFIVDFKRERIIIGGLDSFFRKWIAKNRKEIIKKCLLNSFKNLGISKDFDIFVDTKKKKEEKENIKDIRDNDSLNDHFTFSNFVNGNNTSIAYAAANSVAKGSCKYNPLFLCGDVGLGKTHLMQSIGNEIKIKNKKVLYCTSETFVNDFIDGIRHKTIGKVKEKYRECDCLLIDDIQFLENKEATQEEFFHTFNHLINTGKQIVITADRYPKELKNIEERLITRFFSGMVAKIEKPDFETRVAIIKNEIERKKIPLSEDVILHLAHTIKTNVREIKGVITHLEAEYSLLSHEIDLDSARIILKDILNLDKSPISIGKVTREVGLFFDLKISDIRSEKRDKNISLARQISMFITREITDMSYPVIGRYFDKNHTSAIQSYKKIKNSIEEDPELKQAIQSITKKIIYEN